MSAGPAVMEAQRLRLIRLAQSERLPVREVLRLAGRDLDTLAGCTDSECLAYARALLLRAERRAGRAPSGWTQSVRCEGCGPVWLWHGAPGAVIACPWCWNRVEGLPVPGPLDAF